MEKIIIVGGVAAGATAAAKLRRLSPDIQITMFEAGPDISFANCGLPYYIAGDIKSRSKLILQSPESFKTQYGVDVEVNTRITDIDRSNKQVTALNVKTGETSVHTYDKLLLAQGGRPVKPAIEGADADHVFTLWTLNDMDNIQRHIEEKAPKTAVVIGGGFIGLEMVEALVKRGLQVHLVEMLPHVMAGMDAETAGFLEMEMKAYGVHIHTGKGVTAISHAMVKLSDNTTLDADMIIMSIGVRPTLQLAIKAGLEIGESGGLLVNEYLQTSDEAIFAAGDMVEIKNRISGRKVRIPLAGPANRQGRIAAENILGGKHEYKGSTGTSVLRVFEAIAGITGLSLHQARAAGLPADAVVVHKEHHTSYYPGAENVSVMLVYNSETGAILGGQTAGYKGADRRLDVIATAIAGGLSIHDLADTDFAYSPPLGTANDAMNMAAYAAENKKTGYSSSVVVAEIDNWVKKHNPVIVDVRDMFAFEKANVLGAYNIPLEMVCEQMTPMPKDAFILVYDENGKKGHQAVRALKGIGLNNTFYVSGGFISLERQAFAAGFKHLHMSLAPLDNKTIGGVTDEQPHQETAASITIATTNGGPLVVDVRTPGEFLSGAYPEAINICLDELERRIDEFGDRDRDITLYCASGARSAYAEQVMRQLGFTNVRNGGGLMQMMMNRKK